MGREQLKPYLGAILAGAVIGVPVAIAALAFTTAVHQLELLLWDDLPRALDLDEPPWWLVLALPTLAGVLVALAIRLPGKGGHGPLDGLSMAPAPPLHVVSVVLAALATLGFGLVLGPEAPLIAIGLTLGTLAARALRLQDQAAMLVGLAGAFAAISTIFGGPIVSSLLLFEVAAVSGALAARQIPVALVPGLVAAGVGALVFTGVGKIPGVDRMSLSVPGLPEYGAVRVVDVAWCLLVALAVALAAAGARQLAQRIARVPSGPAALLAGGGLLVGALALAFRAVADRPVDLVLFSGQSSMGAIVEEGAAGVLVAVVVGKALAYAISLGAGFRGGAIFPAVFLGVAGGALGAAVLPGLDLTPAIVAGIAAGAAASMRLAFFGALMAVLLAGTAGANAVPIAILAAVIGWLVGLAIERGRGEPGQAGATDAPATQNDAEDVATHSSGPAT